MTNNTSIDTSMYGYIYVRDNTSYIVDGVYKLGKASNIPDRDSVYATSELNRGEFVMVIAVPIKQMGIINKCMISISDLTTSQSHASMKLQVFIMR